MSELWAQSAADLGASIAAHVNDAGLFIDGSANAHTLSLLWGAEVLGQAVDFDGISGYAKVPDHDGFDLTDDCTFELFIKPRTADVNAADILRHGSGGNRFRVAVSSANTANAYLIWNLDHPSHTGSQTTGNRTANTTMAVTKPVHVVLSYSSGVTTAYLDGVSKTVSSVGNVFASGNQVDIGRQNNNTKLYNGLFYAWAFYQNLAFSQAQVDAQYEILKPLSSDKWTIQTAQASR